MNTQACIRDAGGRLGVRNRAGHHPAVMALPADGGRGRVPGREAPDGLTRRSGAAGAPYPTQGKDLVWVAATGSRVVGMIRVAANGGGKAQVRRVRVDPEWYHTSVAQGLIDQVRAFYARRGYTRIEFEPGSAPSWFQALAERRGFGNLHRTRRGITGPRSE